MGTTTKTKTYPQPVPSWAQAVGDYVPGYTQMTCPHCHFPYCGDTTKSLSCERCARKRFFPEPKVP